MVSNIATHSTRRVASRVLAILGRPVNVHGVLADIYSANYYYVDIFAFWCLK